MATSDGMVMAGPRTTRGRIVLVLGLFAAWALVAASALLWVTLSDAHESARVEALSELSSPIVAQARTRLVNVPSNGITATRRYVLDARSQLDASSVGVDLARDDGTVLDLNIGPGSGVRRFDLASSPRGDAPRSGVAAVTAGGRVAYSATRIFEDRTPGGARWLIITRPETGAGLMPSDLLGAILILSVALAVGGLLLGLLLERGLVPPLARLAAAGGAMARGEVPEPLPLKGPVEVDAATAAFNGMSAEMASSRRAQVRLMADLRHDLGAPLAVISRAVGAFQDGTASPEDAERAARAVADEKERLERIVDDLGKLNEVEHGADKLRPEMMDASRVVQAAVPRFAAQAAARGQQVGIRGATAPLWVSIDRGAMDRILANLCANAMAHAPSPDGHLWLEAEPVSAIDPPVGGPGGWVGAPGVIVCVRDDGSGIPESALTHVFDRFFVADPGRSGPGSGLGLSIVQELALAHAGRAFAENIRGGGARVGVVLPAVAGPSSTETPPPPRRQSSGRSRTRKSSREQAPAATP